MMPTNRTLARTALIFATAAALGACSSEQGGGGGTIPTAHSDKVFDQKPSPPAADYAALIAGANDFGFDLYRKLPGDGNVIYSPISVAAALSMTYAGAAGNTAAQMKAVLHDTVGGAGYATAWNKLLVDLDSRNVAVHHTEDGDKSLKLHLVDAAFAQQGYDFVPGYLDTLAVHYDAGVSLLDFAKNPEGARGLINQWAADNTEQKIKDLLPPGSIDGDTKLVLGNALYFYGSWATPFDVHQTANATFHAPAGDVSASTMNGVFTVPYAEGDGYKLAQLPYDGGAIAMTLVLPDDGKLAEVEAGLSSAWLTKADGDLHGQVTDVGFALPKFKFTWGTSSLAEPLQKLGMTDAFANPPADFSGIEAKKQLYISDVFHKAFVGVDEYGTEAAAATAVVLNDGSVPPPPKPFVLDRPFLFVLRDTTSGAVLFVGKVLDPTK